MFLMPSPIHYNFLKTDLAYFQLAFGIFLLRDAKTTIIVPPSKESPEGTSLG